MEPLRRDLVAMMMRHAPEEVARAILAFLSEPER